MDMHQKRKQKKESKEKNTEVVDNKTNINWGILLNVNCTINPYK